jgi:hypothetical protein
MHLSLSMLCFVGNDFLKSRFFHGDIFINSHLWEGNYIICLCTVLSLVDKTFGLVLTDKTMTFYDRLRPFGFIAPTIFNYLTFQSFDFERT